MEPDIVATKDGVVVIRHENEISGTTDVADRPEFAHLKTTKIFLGHVETGWFTEDFTWEELSTLRCRERLPDIRRESASFDGEEPILRLIDLLEMLDAARAERGTAVGAVIEIKHAAYFAAIGLDLVPLLRRDLRETGWDTGDGRLTIESFEQDALTRLQQHAVRATYVYLMENEGCAVDLFARFGESAPTYAQQMSPEGLDLLAAEVDGISLDKDTLLAPDARGRARGSRVVDDAHERGLTVFTWTCRPENTFLIGEFSGDVPAAFGDYTGEWELLRRAGVDGVFVDHADLGMNFFRPEGGDGDDDPRRELMIALRAIDRMIEEVVVTDGGVAPAVLRLLDACWVHLTSTGEIDDLAAQAAALITQAEEAIDRAAVDDDASVDDVRRAFAYGAVEELISLLHGSGESDAVQDAADEYRMLAIDESLPVGTPERDVDYRREQERQQADIVEAMRVVDWASVQRS